MYEIEFSAKAAKTYLELPRKLRTRLDSKLEVLAARPYAKHNNVKALKGMAGCYRLRINNWRVIYEVVNKKLKIYITSTWYKDCIT